MRRFSMPLALAAATAVYAILFMVLDGSGVLLRVAVPAALAALAAVGVQLLLGRTPREVADDDYHGDARTLVADVDRLLAEAETTMRRSRDPYAKAAVSRARRTVGELLERIAADQPTSLYSSASTWRGHAESLRGVARAFVDLESNPHYYRDAPARLAAGRAAIERFDRFSIESMQLVTSGAMAEYQANLDTVAPPELPTLEG